MTSPRNIPPAAAPVLPYDPLLRDADNIVRKMSLYATMCLLFLRFSSVHEFITGLIGVPTRVMYVVIPVAGLSLVLSRGLNRALSTKLGWLWIAFTCWLLAGIPFSSWPTGSLESFMDYSRMTLPVYFLVAGSILTAAECKQVAFCAAIAAAIPILFSLLFAETIGGGRLALDFSGTIANPNDLAAHILWLLPFLAFVVLRPKTMIVFRMAAAGLIVLGLYAALRTGSRGALIAAATGILVYLSRSSARQRIVALLLIALAIVAISSLLPDTIVQRLKSFSADSEVASVEALQSAESRQYLLRRSVEFTVKYPIFGVGMGQFHIFEGVTSREAGGRGNWHETHNAYTQISSEAGIPALLLFLACVVIAFRNFSAVHKRAKTTGDADLSLLALMCLVGHSLYCAVIIFLSQGYAFVVPLMSGLSVAMLRIAPRPPLRPPPTPDPRLAPRFRSAHNLFAPKIAPSGRPGAGLR